MPSNSGSSTTDDIYEELAQEFEQIPTSSYMNAVSNMMATSMDDDNDSILVDESKVVQQYNLHKIPSSTMTQFQSSHSPTSSAIPPLQLQAQHQHQHQHHSLSPRFILHSTPVSTSPYGTSGTAILSSSLPTLTTPRSATYRRYDQQQQQQQQSLQQQQHQLPAFKVGNIIVKQQRNFLGRTFQQQDSTIISADPLTCNLLEIRDQLPNHIKISIDFLSQNFITIDEENNHSGSSNNLRKLKSPNRHAAISSRSQLEYDIDHHQQLTTTGRSQRHHQQQQQLSSIPMTSHSNPSTPRSSNVDEEGDIIEMISSVQAMGSTLSSKMKSASTKSSAGKLLRKTNSIDGIKLDTKLTNQPSTLRKQASAYDSKSSPNSSSQQRMKVPPLKLQTTSLNSSPSSSSSSSNLLTSQQSSQNHSNVVHVEKWREDDQMIDDDMEMVSVDSKYGKSKLTNYYENIGNSNDSILETFEDTFPVIESKKDMRVNVAMQDLLLTKHQYSNDDYQELSLLFEPRSLNLDVFKVVSQDIERLYCSVTIYEHKNKVSFVRATETFHFEFMTSKSNRAVFKIRKNADLTQFYLFFKMSRQFKGEYTDYVNDLYLKGEKAKDKDVLYLCSSSRQKYFTSVQHIYSPFAWTVASVQQSLSRSVATVPIYLLNFKQSSSSDGQLTPEQLLSIAIQNIVDHSPTSMDSTLTNVGNSHSSSGSSSTNSVSGGISGIGSIGSGNSSSGSNITGKKMKMIPGSFEFSLTELVRRSVSKEIDPVSFNVIYEKNNGEIISAAEKIRLKSFKHDFINLNNCMYLYPLSFRSPNSDHRFIQIVVTFHRSDGVQNINSHNSSTLRLLSSTPSSPSTPSSTTTDHSVNNNIFYNSYSSNPDLFESEGRTQVMYKSRAPEFNDEIKCILPCTMTTKHHFVFHFYNCIHKEKMLSKLPPNGRDYIGYATLPVMMADNSLIADGEYTLDFYPDSKMPTGNYLSEKGKNVVEKCFKVKIITSSIAYPDVALSGILSVINRDITAHTNFAGVGELVTKLPHNLHAMAPVILTQMLNYLNRLTQKSRIFEILDVIMKLFDRTRRENSAILLNFIKYHYCNSNSIGDSCHSLLNAIRLYVVDDSVDVDLWLPNFGLLFSLLFKSIVIKAAETNGEFSIDFYHSIQQLSENVVLFLQRAMEKKEVTKTKTVNSIFACFLRHLLSLLDRQFVVTTAARYISLVGDIDAIAMKNDSFRSLQTIVEMQFIFFEEFFSYNKYIELFIVTTRKPGNNSNNTFEHMEQIDKHYMFSLYCDIVIKYLLNESYSIRMRAITFFRSFICKFSLTDGNEPELTAMIMFEFVLKFLDKMNEWKEIGDGDRKKAYDTLVNARKSVSQIVNQIVSKKEQLNALKDLQKETTQILQMQQKLKNEIQLFEEQKVQLLGTVTLYETEYQISLERNIEERRHLLICIIHILECCLSKHEDEFAQSLSSTVNNNNQNQQQNSPNTSSTVNTTKLSLMLMCLQLCLQAFEYEGAQILTPKLESLYSKYFKTATIVTNDIFENTLSTIARKTRSSSSAAVSGTSSANRSGNNSGSSTPNSSRSRKGTLHHLNDMLFGAFGGGNSSSSNNNSNNTSMGGNNSSSSTGLPILSSNSKQQQAKRKTSSAIAPPKHTTTSLANSGTSNNSSPNRLNTNASNNSPSSSSVLRNRDISEFNFDNIKNMQHLSERIGMLTFRILVIIVERNERYLDESELNPLMENIVRTFLNFLYLNQSKYVLVTVLSYLKYFFDRYKRIILREEFCDFSILFCEPLMRLLNSKFKSVRQHSTSLLYLLILFHYESNHTGGSDGIESCRIMTNLSLSRTLRYITPVEDYMTEAFKLIAQYGYRDLSLSSESHMNFSEQLVGLTKDLQTLLRDTMAISKCQHQQPSALISATSSSRGKQKVSNGDDDNDDPQKIEELYYRIALLYRNIPELTIEWLQQLIAHHKNVGQHAEAAQAYFQIIAIVFDILLQNQSKILRGLPVRDFFRVTPNISHFYNNNYSNQPQQQQQQQPNGADRKLKIPNSWEFTEEGIIFLFKSAVEMLENADQMETTLPIFKILLILLERNHMWGELALLTSGQMFNIYHRIDQYSQEKNQLFPLYYRIRFLGNSWSSQLNGKQFIYKMPKGYKLNVMTKYIKSSFGEDVHLINNPGKIDLTSLDENIRYIQLTNVKPFHPHEDDNQLVSSDNSQHYYSDNHSDSDDVVKRKSLTMNQFTGSTNHFMSSPNPTQQQQQQQQQQYAKLSEFERNTNCKTFYYQTAFTKNAKKLSDKVTEVYKRRVIITLEHFFPFVKTRLPVIHEEEQILTPIEAAIENIVEQNRKLEECLYYNPPDIPQLQMVLKGSVAVEVNSGPLEIMSSFLQSSSTTPVNEESEENTDIGTPQKKLARSNNSDSKLIQKLNQKCFIFIQLCEIGVRIHGEYAGPEYRQFDITLRQKLNDLKGAAQKYVKPVEPADQLKQLVQLKDYLKKNLAFSVHHSIFESSSSLHHHHSSATTPTSSVGSDRPTSPTNASSSSMKRSSMRYSIPQHKLQYMQGF